MNKKEAQKRNWNICLLTGILPMLKHIIPRDIKDKMQPRDLKQFESFAERLLECINETKIKHFTCDKCSPIHGKQITNKKAYHCDFCKEWKDKLYTIKEN